MANLSGLSSRSQAVSSTAVNGRSRATSQESRNLRAVSGNVMPPQPKAWKVAETLEQSFQYAGNGVEYAFRTQRNFRIHAGMTALALSLGLGLHLAPVELAIIGITCGLVMAMELMNTAVEAVVDLTVGDRYHELAKVAKDCAAGAVLVSACIAIWVASLLLLPGLWHAAVGVLS